MSRLRLVLPILALVVAAWPAPTQASHGPRSAQPRHRAFRVSLGRRTRVGPPANERVRAADPAAISPPTAAGLAVDGSPPAGGSAPASAGSESALFEDHFDVGDGLITNEYATWNPSSTQASPSPAWTVTSGSLFARGGAGWTGIPDGCATSSPRSTPCTASDVFRLDTKERDFGDVTVSMELVNDGLTSSKRTPKVRRGGCYILDTTGIWIDADEFEREADAGLTALAEGLTGPAGTHLSGALALYQDGFLAEEPYLDWAVEERERLQEQVGRVLRAQVRISTAAGQLGTAAGHARRLVDMEPFDSDVLRLYLRICLRRGRRSEAFRRYALFRKGMLQAFGQEPDFELADVERELAKAKPEGR